MSTISLVIKTNKSDSEVIKANQPRENLNRVMNIAKGILSGIHLGAAYIQSSSSDPVSASGTLTLVSAIATDAITIGTVTLTASSTPANENQWEIDGASDTADAASLAAAINAHTVLGKIVSATSALGVVTVSSLQKGVVGNFIPLSSADATITASGAFLTGGTGGATSAAVQIRG
jgi:hypothetical protein